MNVSRMDLPLKDSQWGYRCDCSNSANTLKFNLSRNDKGPLFNLFEISSPSLVVIVSVLRTNALQTILTRQVTKNWLPCCQLSNEMIASNDSDKSKHWSNESASGFCLGLRHVLHLEPFQLPVGSLAVDDSLVSLLVPAFLERSIPLHLLQWQKIGTMLYTYPTLYV